MNSKLFSFENGKTAPELLELDAFQAEALSIVAPLIEKDGVQVRLKSNISDFRIESSTVLRCANTLSKPFGIQVVPAQLFGHRTFGDLLGFLYEDSYRARAESVKSARLPSEQSCTEPQNLAAKMSAGGKRGFNRCEILRAPSHGMPFLVLLSSGTAAGLAKIKKEMLRLMEAERKDSLLASLEYHGVKAEEGMPFRDAMLRNPAQEQEHRSSAAGRLGPGSGPV